MIHSLSELSLSGKDFDNSVAPAADNPAAVSAPNNATHPLAAHQPMTGDFVSAASLLKVPKAQTSVVSGRNQLATIRRQRKRGDRTWMGQHCIRALT